MKINLQLLIRQLDFEGFLLSEADSSKGYIRNVSVFDPEAPLLPSYAYLLDSDDAGHLKNIKADRNCAFIVLYDEAAEPGSIPYVHNVLHVRTGQKLHIVLNKVQQVFDKYNEWEIRLADAVIKRVQIDDLLGIAAELFPDPIALFDSSFSLIGHGGYIPDEFDDPIWKTVVTENYASVQNLPRDFREYYKKIPKSRRIICFPAFPEKSDNRILMVHLLREGHIFAILAMDELCGPYEPCDLVILDTIRNWLEHSELIFRLAAISADNSSKVFLDLLDGRSISPALMDHLVLTQGWQNCRKYVIIRMTSPNRVDEFNEKNAASFIRRLKSSDSNISPYYHQGEIVALMQCDKDYRSVDDLSESFVSLVNAIGIHAGISLPFNSLSHIYEAGVQAGIALRYSDHDLMVSFGKIYPLYIKDKLAVDGKTEYFTHPAVVYLHEQQKQDLLRTLYWYLETGMQLSETARILGIHRNTVSYRLETVEDMCSIDLQRIAREESLHIRVSCILMW